MAVAAAQMAEDPSIAAMRNADHERLVAARLHGTAVKIYVRMEGMELPGGACCGDCFADICCCCFIVTCGMKAAERRFRIAAC